MATRPWTPADITSAPVIEFDATVATAFGGSSAPANGAKIAAFASKDGSKSAAQSNSTNQPIYSSTGLNGFPALQYSGAQFLDVAAFAQNQTWAAFSVFSVSNASNTQNLVDSDNNSTGKLRLAQHLRVNTTAIESIAFDSSVNPYVARSAVNIAANTPVIAGANRTSTLLSLAVNGGGAATAGTSNTPASGTAPLRLGAFSNNAQYLTGYQAYSGYALGAITQDEFDRWTGYLAWKFGLQGSLPANHPYKAAAPTVATGGSSYVLNSSAGFFQVVGAAVPLRLQRLMVAGALAVSGRPATQAWTHGASSGVFTVSGVATRQAITRQSGPGALALAGGPSTAAKGTTSPSVYTLSITTGSLGITGRPATLAHIYMFACAQGALAITGRTSPLALARSGVVSTVQLTGPATAKAVTRPGLGGASTITGGAASRGVARAAGTGVLALTGPGAARAIAFAAPASGQRTISGRPTSLASARFASPGSFVLGGGGAVLRSLRILAAGPGAYAITGSAAGYTYSHTGSYVLGASTGQYTVSMFADGSTKPRPFMKRKRVRFGLSP